MSDETKKKREASIYLVQMRKSVEGATDWTDVDLISVPAGTKRLTLLNKVGQMDLGLEVGERAMIRLIPEEHAVMEQIALVQPEPQMKVGS